MAAILCVPVCSNCQSVIEYVDVETTSGVIGNNNEFQYAQTGITPNKCVKCGARFKTLVVPMKLPIEAKELFEQWNND